jgi:N-acyl-phosphatidylethanolamine-hydrolysing phospholipase D
MSEDKLYSFRHYKKGKKFINPYEKQLKKRPPFFLLWKLGYYDEPVLKESAPKDFDYPISDQKLDATEPSCVWINHSTFLINIGGVSILTDPLFSKSCSPISFIGPKRRQKPAIELEDLPKIDFILISHNHYDHLDKSALKKLVCLFPDVKIIVPLGDKKWMQKKIKTKNIYEFDWWKSHLFKNNDFSINVTSVPSQHFSGRSLFDFNKSLWSGYVLEFNFKDNIIKKLYFCGDSGYNEYDFKMIGQRFKSIDLSLIPIGTYLPRKFMKPVHVNPKEALQIHLDTNSKFSIGMHWKTFHLSDEGMDMPPYELYLAMKEENLDLRSFVALAPGRFINW